MHRRLVFAFGTVMIVAALRNAHAGEAPAGGKKLHQMVFSVVGIHFAV